jgi:hypothetical protein
VEHPHGRRIQIIELTVARRPDERRDRNGDDKQREREHDIENAHVARSSKVRERHDAMTTVSELTGIKTAAMSGVSCPRIAKAAPTTL